MCSTRLTSESNNSAYSSTSGSLEMVDVRDRGVVQSRTEKIATEGDCVDLAQRSITVRGRDWCERNPEAACDQPVVWETDWLYSHIGDKLSTGLIVYRFVYRFDTTHERDRQTVTQRESETDTAWRHSIHSIARQLPPPNCRLLFCNTWNGLHNTHQQLVDCCQIVSGPVTCFGGRSGGRLQLRSGWRRSEQSKNWPKVFGPPCT